MTVIEFLLKIAKCRSSSFIESNQNFLFLQSLVFEKNI